MILKIRNIKNMQYEYYYMWKKICKLYINNIIYILWLNKLTFLKFKVFFFSL